MQASRRVAQKMLGYVAPQRFKHRSKCKPSNIIQRLCLTRPLIARDDISRPRLLRGRRTESGGDPTWRRSDLMMRRDPLGTLGVCDRWSDGVPLRCVDIHSAKANGAACSGRHQGIGPLSSSSAFWQRCRVPTICLDFILSGSRSDAPATAQVSRQSASPCHREHRK